MLNDENVKELLSRKIHTPGKWGVDSRRYGLENKVRK
jgi:hypothetical protein